METLARLNINAILIHFNNASFGWIKAQQAIHCNSRFFSVDFNAYDLKMVAQGFGLKALRVDNLSELEDGLAEVFRLDGPVFLDIKTESDSVDLPPVYSWEKAQENSQGYTG